MEREEYKRKAIHIGMGLWAFYPLFVTKYYAFLILIIFLILVLFVFREHRWKAAFDAMARQEDYMHGYLMGPLIYILAVMVCVWFYPPYVAAASFAIMAFGDGVATIVGRNWGDHHYPYSDKTIEGSLGFLAAGFLSTVLILLVLTHVSTFAVENTISHLAAIGLLGTVCGAAVETLPFTWSRGKNLVMRAFIDDNFFVPVIAGLAMSLYVIL
jgi:dolichol kinase